MPTQDLGTADLIQIGGDEKGFVMYLSTDTGTYAVNIHAVAADLYWQARREIGAWLNEAEIARRTRPVTDDADAYPADDPKNENWHSVHADLHDSREGK